MVCATRSPWKNACTFFWLLCFPKALCNADVILPLSVGAGFQVLFHSPPGVLFTFPSRYYTLSVTREYLSLGGWSPRLPTGFHVSCGTPDPARMEFCPRTGLSPSPAGLSSTVLLLNSIVLAVHTPKRSRRCVSVWASPLSLAATHGLSFDFFSCPYLDVSVQGVPPV